MECGTVLKEAHQLYIDLFHLLQKGKKNSQDEWRVIDWEAQGI
jgi:hypothetical protein